MLLLREKQGVNESVSSIAESVEVMVRKGGGEVRVMRLWLWERSRVGEREGEGFVLGSVEVRGVRIEAVGEDSRVVCERVVKVDVGEVGEIREKLLLVEEVERRRRACCWRLWRE